MAEYYLNVVSNAGSLVWSSGSSSEAYQLIHSLEDTLRIMRTVADEKTYYDAHAWCFVPHSFRLIIHDLFDLGFIPFQELGFYPTEGHEFYITLGREGKGIDRSRLEMLQIIESELKDGGSLLTRSKRMIKRLLRSSTLPPFRFFPRGRPSQE